MKQKKLQKQSKYDEYDIDGDGIVSDEEFDMWQKLKNLSMIYGSRELKVEWQLPVWLQWLLLLLQCSLSISKELKHLADISNLFYLTGGGIVAAYMGASAIMNRNGK